jgi:hypothetical protein
MKKSYCTVSALWQKHRIMDISYTQDVYMSHVTMLCVSVIYIFFERVTIYNNAKRTRGKLQRFISTVLQFPATRYARA